MTIYSETSVPSIKNAGNQITLTDIQTGSKIDVIRLLGRKASKIIIEVKTGQSIAVSLNTAKRVVGPFVDGVTDIDGNTSDLPAFGYAEVDSGTGLATKVVGADNVADRAYNIWAANGLDITVSSGVAATWNSYDSYGDLNINSVEFTLSGGISTLTCTFVA